MHIICANCRSTHSTAVAPPISFHIHLPHAPPPTSSAADMDRNDSAVCWTRAEYNANPAWSRADLDQVAVGNGICGGLCYAWVAGILVRYEYPHVYPNLPSAIVLQGAFNGGDPYDNAILADVELCESDIFPNRYEVIDAVFNYYEDRHDLKTAYVITFFSAPPVNKVHMVAIVRGRDNGWFLGPNSGCCRIDTSEDAYRRISQEPNLEAWEALGPFRYRVDILAIEE